jgi:hypothetical protein
MGNKHQPRIVAFTFRDCQLFALFLVNSGVGKNSPRYPGDDSDVFLGEVDSESFVVVGCSGLAWMTPVLLDHMN